MISALAAVLLVFLICVYTRTAARGDPETVKRFENRRRERKMTTFWRKLYNESETQVYAQRLVGAHKKLQQADTEPFQVKISLSLFSGETFCREFTKANVENI